MDPSDPYELNDSQDQYGDELADDAIEDREQRDSLEGASQDEKPRSPRVQYVNLQESQERERKPQYLLNPSEGSGGKPKTTILNRGMPNLTKPPIPRRETGPVHTDLPHTPPSHGTTADAQSTISRLSEKVRDQASRILKLGKDLQQAQTENSDLKAQLSALAKTRPPSHPAVEQPVEPSKPFSPSPHSHRPTDSTLQSQIDQLTLLLEKTFAENEELIKYKLDTDRRMCNLAKMNQSLLKELDVLERKHLATKTQMNTVLGQAKDEERLTNQARWAAKFTRQLMSLTLEMLVSLTSDFLSTAITHKDFETLVTFVDTWVDEVKRGDTLAAEATVAGSRKIFESLLHEEGEIVARLEKLAANIHPPENDGPQ